MNELRNAYYTIYIILEYNIISLSMTAGDAAHIDIFYSHSYIII